MSVEAAEWRFVGRQTLTAAGVAGVMDAIFTLGTATTYADGTTRTPGTGSAGTWSRFQAGGTTEAVYCTPAVAPLNHRIILAARSAAPTPSPTMASPDTFQASTLLVNLVKNAGAFNAWNASAPFTSGQTFGYWRVTGVNPHTSLTGTINMWESRDSVAILLLSSSLNCYVFAGALFDPESTDVVSDAETDGKVYGIISGSNQWTATMFDGAWLTNTQYSAMRHFGSVGANHAGVFVPNSANVAVVGPMGMLFSFGTTDGTAMYTYSGRIVRIPIVFRAQGSQVMIGRLREVVLGPDARIPQRLMSGSVPLGYFFGPNDTSSANCVILEH